MPERFDSDAQVLGARVDLFGRQISFNPDSRAHLARLSDGDLVFRIGTEAGIRRALLVVGDRSGALGHDFALVGAAAGFALWELRIDPPAETFTYTLALGTDEGAAVYVSPTGITNRIERIDRFTADVGSIPTHDVPGWAVGTPIYQIFPDRFANGDPSLDPSDVRPWAGPPTRSGFQGGDLAGIGQRAAYLAGLGVGAVYLNPIFASPSTHRYDTRDYRTVDPLLGGADALHLLVKELHGRGVALILDISINHAHPRWEPFADVVANGVGSPYAGWFVVDDFPVRIKYRPHLIEAGTWWAEVAETIEAETGLGLEAVGGDGPIFEPTFEAWEGVPTMPRINLANPDALAHMLDVLRFWVAEFDIDGWRLDVARYVDHDVWPKVRAAVRSVQPDVYLLSEIMGDASRWLEGDEFDATMNYSFRHLCVDYFARRAVSSERFMEGFLRMLGMYSPEVAQVSHNLLGSHDTPRFLTEAGGAVDRLRLATLFQMTVPGAPGIYYGDEIALEGADDPFCRGTFRWDEAEANPLVDHLRHLGTLRRERPALRDGAFRLRSVKNDLIVFDRIGADETITMALNGGDRHAQFDIGSGRDVLFASGQVEQNGTVVTLQAMSGAVIR